MYNAVDYKAEDAIKAYLDEMKQADPAITGLTIIPGQSVEALEDDRIAVICTAAVDAREEEGIDDIGATLGNWVCTMMVLVTANHKTSRTTRAARESAVIDLLLEEDVVAQLNSSFVGPDFFVYGGGLKDGNGEGLRPKAITPSVVGKTYVRGCEFDLYCRPSGPEPGEI